MQDILATWEKVYLGVFSDLKPRLNVTHFMPHSLDRVNKDNSRTLKAVCKFSQCGSTEVFGSFQFCPCEVWRIVLFPFKQNCSQLATLCGHQVRCMQHACVGMASCHWQHIFSLFLETVAIENCNRRSQKLC